MALLTAVQQQQYTQWSPLGHHSAKDAWWVPLSAHFEQLSSQYDTADDKNTVNATWPQMISTPKNRRGKHRRVALRAVRVPRMPNECRKRPIPGDFLTTWHRHKMDQTFAIFSPLTRRCVPLHYWPKQMRHLDGERHGRKWQEIGQIRSEQEISQIRSEQTATSKNVWQSGPTGWASSATTCDRST